MARKILPHELTAEDIAIITRRFWAKVNKDGPIPAHRPDLGPCWEWTHSLFRSGYGGLQYFHTCYRVHRLAWFLETGRWPDPYALHHCDNKKCVRYSHLFEGNDKDNYEDWVSKTGDAHKERVAEMQRGYRRARNLKLMEGMAC
jgi:uncharacterized protein YeaC (DUF1315 family)